METNQTAPAKAAQITEELLIKRCEIVTTKEGKRIYVLHTSPSKVNKPKEGEKESRFKIAEAVFENMARNQAKPAILFMKEVVGAKYTFVSQFVKAGDPWLRGEGTYTQDHHTKVSESIALSNAVIAEDTNAMRNAYYASLFGNANKAATQVAVNVPQGTVSGEDIPV